jgi:hypothetical protein
MSGLLPSQEPKSPTVAKFSAPRPVSRELAGGASSSASGSSPSISSSNFSKPQLSVSSEAPANHAAAYRAMGYGPNETSNRPVIAAPSVTHSDWALSQVTGHGGSSSGSGGGGGGGGMPRLSGGGGGTAAGEAGEAAGGAEAAGAATEAAGAGAAAGEGIGEAITAALAFL